MTDQKQPNGEARPAGVLDPEWEDALRSGQEQEGERGSVEPELALLHLLRHARQPESLEPDALDAIWSDVEAEVAPAGQPWWRRAWVWWTAPVVATAAVLAIVVIQPGASEPTLALDESHAAPQAEEDAPFAKSEEALAEGSASNKDSDEDSARASRERAAGAASATPEITQLGGIAAADGGARSPGASAFESSYIRLEPQGRAALVAAVDRSRDELRDQLLAQARGDQR
ncbi:hypothetical protein G6O69_13775 [Pseudenhygromyxa sp. WMMC2535]|uniref:hypothetical protein n=1 Tax=Pseudenhygromyxa sp. WMMC2535 TaxID=2712867 RepID=UPI0015568F36|nr:hypothetical protein [Pseudenhygromyxa sp. WMMC2535]NVB38906.1 hypothetical protein [Pseudenhygromyxa sp. WMMC2535]